MNADTIARVLFAASTIGMLCYHRRKFARANSSGVRMLLSAKAVIKLLEDRVQLDEGNRGIKQLLKDGENELWGAAIDLVNSATKKVVIITGFPCMLDYTPPTETDGKIFV